MGISLRHYRTLAAIAVGTVALAGCSTDTTAPPTRTVTAVHTTTAPAPPAVTVSQTDTATDTETATVTATVTATATVTRTVTDTAPPTDPPPTLSGDDLIAAAEQAAGRAGVDPADPDEPGPDGGATCAADATYLDEEPTGLRSDARRAWIATVKAAADQGITLCLNDGKRSVAQQQAVFDDYVTQYGQAVAEELVLPPKRSAHVVGLAVDVQPAAGYQWLQATGGSEGFCRIYDNEPWHFEFNPAYPDTGCPDRLPEPER